MNSPDPGIHLAQVNCVVYGDFCEANKIEYFPKLNLYRNGEFVDTFAGAREYDALLEYVSKHAEPTSTPQAPPSATSPQTSQTTVEAPTMTKPVEVLHVQTPRADINPSGSVLALGSHNFQDVVNQGPVFVKYFAPWYVQMISLEHDLDFKIGAVTVRSLHRHGNNWLGTCSTSSMLQKLTVKLMRLYARPKVSLAIPCWSIMPMASNRNIQAAERLTP
jgi:hypothetical protein